MIPIASGAGDAIEWVQPSAMSRAWELRDGDRTAGLLTFRSAFGSLAAAQFEAGAWTFKRTGFFSPKVTARREGEETDIAVYEPAFSRSKGVLRLAGGETLHVHSTNFWQTEWTLSDDAGNLLIECHNRGVFRRGARVNVSDTGRRRPDLSMLVGLFWYILVLYMEDSAAVAAV